MDRFKIIGLIHGLDVEIEVTYDAFDDIAPIVLMMKNGGLQPKPRFQAKDSTPFEPFLGKVESVEETKTKNDKQMFIAHVRPDTPEGEPKKDLVAVKYMPPKSTWRIGDPVKVTKNDRGWLEIHESENAEPF